MALIKCPDCGREVSDRAASCPSCAAPLAGAAAPKPVLAERELLSVGSIRVTTTRFIVPAQTYAMSGVTSVGSAVETPSRLPVIALILCGIMVMMCGGAFSGSANGLMLGMGAVGVLLIVGGILVARSLKPTHHVVLRTAGGEVRALSSQDAAYIQRIIAALNDAIVARG